MRVWKRNVSKFVIETDKISQNCFDNPCKLVLSLQSKEKNETQKLLWHLFCSRLSKDYAPTNIRCCLPIISCLGISYFLNQTNDFQARHRTCSNFLSLSGVYCQMNTTGECLQNGPGQEDNWEWEANRIAIVTPYSFFVTEFNDSQAHCLQITEPTESWLIR